MKIRLSKEEKLILLKAAMWLIERVNNTDTGETDASGGY